MMEKAKLFIPAFISLGLMILLALVFTNELKKKKLGNLTETKENYYLAIENNNNKCEKSIYKDNIYLYCINEIYYLENNDKKSLRSVLDDKISADKIISDMVLIQDTEDYKLYEDKNSIASINFKVLHCNDLYIIGTTELKYQEEFCE